jgi:hypothetical protein
MSNWVLSGNKQGATGMRLLNMDAYRLMFKYPYSYKEIDVCITKHGLLLGERILTLAVEKKLSISDTVMCLYSERGRRASLKW